MASPIRPLLGLLPVVFILSACRTPERDVVARVGDEVLTRSELEAMMPPEMAQNATGEVYLDQARRWMRTRLLAQEARRLDLDDDPEVKQLVRERTEEALAEALVTRLLDSVPESDETQLRKYYEEHQQDFLRLEPEVGLRRIHFPDQATASALRTGLTPANFASEAARLDPAGATASQTGRLWRRGDLPPGVGDIVFALQEGEISPPVQLPDGWGVFLVISKAPVGSVRPFQDVVDLIRVRLAEATRRGRLDDLVARLSRQSDVVLDTRALPGADTARASSSNRK